MSNGHTPSSNGHAAWSTPKGVPIPAHDLNGATGHMTKDGYTTYYGANPGPGWSHRKENKKTLLESFQLGGSAHDS